MDLGIGGSNMKSIRTKMFLAFFGIILAIILVFIVFNAFLYKEYIIKKNELEFEKISKEISEIYYSNDDYLKSYIRNIAMNKGIQIDIVHTKTQQIVYSSRGYIKANGKNITFDLNNKSTFLLEDRLSRVNSDVGEVFIKSFRISNDYAIIMYKPFVMIYDRAASSTKFIILVSLFVILPGIILVNYTTKKHVKPILQLQKQTTLISKLDFSSRFESKKSDEIAILGENINKISDKLSSTINDLESDIEKLNRADDMRRQFLASVSHELKTPLSIISSYAESIKMGIVDKEDEEEYLSTIIEEASRLNDMVRKLTSTFKMQFVSKERLEEVDLSILLSDITQKHNRTNQHLIKLIVECDVKCVIDKKSIIQVMDNFIVNAQKHMEKNTQIIVTLSKKGSNARIGIFNNGTKIPEDRRNKIWDEFYKVDKARQRGEAGTGLGLYINKNIIEWHNGTYGFENKEDGVEFYVLLPSEA